MRKLLFLLFLLIPSLAFAGSNIRQNSDGSTSWVDENSVSWPVGDTGLAVNFVDLSTASTVFVTSDRPGRIKRVYATHNGGFSSGSASSVLTIGIDGDGDGNFTAISAGATLTVATAITGGMSSVTPDPVNVSVGQGDVISIKSNGGGTGTTIGTITIVIE